MMKAGYRALIFGVLVMMGSSVVGAETFTVGAFSFATPAGWTKEKPTSRMRAAELSVPGKDGAETAEVTFFFFGPRSGTVEANKKRWLGQFEDRTNDGEETKTIGGKKLTYVSTEGTFMSGPPFGQKVAKKNHGLLGAILEGEGGNVFVKMTGPLTTTKAASEAFKAMVEKAME